MYNRPVKNFLLVIGAAFLFCYAAYENHYPLTTSDTGTYITSGFLGKVPDDRPILYGLFIRHISLAESLYFVILAQGMLLAYLLFLYFKYFVSVSNKAVWYVLLILMLVFYTGASVNVSQLIADIFTPLMILSLGLLVSSFLNTREIVVTGAIFVFSVSTHFSHTLICFLILSALTFSTFFFFKKESTLKRALLLKIWLLFLAASLVIPTVHYFYSGYFRSSNSKHIFMMAKLHEMGILDIYLKNRCKELDLKICPYKDNIPRDFLWDFSNSPIYKTGGWEANKEEYNFIIKDVLTTPRYLKKFVEKAASQSFSTFFTFSTGDVPRADANSEPYRAVKWFFPDDIRQFTSCAQNDGRLDYTFLNNRQLLLLVFSSFLLFVLCTLNFRGIPFIFKQTGLIILSGLVANAIVCGTLAVVFPRLQSRVVWLFPIFVFLLVLNQWEFIKSTLAGINFRKPS